MNEPVSSAQPRTQTRECKIVSTAELQYLPRGHSGQTHVCTHGHTHSPRAPQDSNRDVSTGPRTNQGRRHTQSEAEGRLLPSMFIGTSAMRDTNQKLLSMTPSARLGQKHREPTSFPSPIIDNIIKKNKFYNNTFSLIC